MRHLFKVLAIMATVALLLAIVVGTALAANYSLSADTSGRYLGQSILSSAYRVQTNLWNPDVTSGGFTISGDDTDQAWSIDTFTANSYANGEFAGGNNAPGGYPSTYKGCHWGGCTAGGGAPFPMQYSEVLSLQSEWSVTTPASGGVWNAAYDIWLDTNASGSLPGSPASLGQNDGAEIMVWINNRGYESGIIAPVGSYVTTLTTLPGGTWDVWAGQLGNSTTWNVISYVRTSANDMNTLAFNAKSFIDDAMDRECAPGVSCVQPAWWLTSVQAGFEIWNGEWPSGQTIGTNHFVIAPISVRGPNTGKGLQPDKKPIIHWEDTFTITTVGCPGASGTWEIVPGNGAASYSGSLEETANSPGVYTGTSSPLNPGHDDSQLTTTLVCPDGQGTQTQAAPVFIDPSGRVLDQNGNPIQDALVTLLMSSSASGPFVPAPADPNVIQPVTNPETTGSDGRFRWDVIGGFYKVRAEKSGCTTIETDVLPVPPPQVNLVLTLMCESAPNPGSMSVIMTPMSDWQTGYCRNVVVTNGGPEAVDWKVTFDLVDGGTINNFWNVIWSQSGNQVTIEGVGWNNVLQPNSSTHSLGFCAAK